MRGAHLSPIHCLLPPIDQTTERYGGSQAK
jgi:hypothetical protein